LSFKKHFFSQRPFFLILSSCDSNITSESSFKDSITCIKKSFKCRSKVFFPDKDIIRIICRDHKYTDAAVSQNLAEACQDSCQPEVQMPFNFQTAPIPFSPDICRNAYFLADNRKLFWCLGNGKKLLPCAHEGISESVSSLQIPNLPSRRLKVSFFCSI
jgi:hypothetical protein